MKNLQERTTAMRESRGKGTGWLYCPQFSLSDEVCVCLAADCAHYNPDTDECIHVEAAQAQVAIAKGLLPVAAVAEPVQTGDIRQAAKWLGQGERVKRLAWTSDCYLEYALGNGAQIVLNTVPSSWQPLLSELHATDWVVVKE